MFELGLIIQSMTLYSTNLSIVTTYTYFCCSIGSLGWKLNEPGVKNVTVKSTTFTKTQNGFRIKSWGKPSNGFVRHVHFVHATMIDVQNPILIDQHYCPFYKGCSNEVSISFPRIILVQGSFGPKIMITFANYTFWHLKVNNCLLC